jgi:mediator of RNA polymerase II transcription subunit 13
MTRAKSLTGFGPAASEEKMPAKILMQLYTPAYILSPKSDFRFKPFADTTEQTNINGSILFCSYCLSDDQRYLLASCSDDRGELLETCSINIEVPDRHRRKIQHARRIGLQKLWEFIMRIVTSTTMPWRIVIGRLGRLGHGELKSWGIILSKKNLVRCATLIRDSCPMCHILRCHDQPVILSACLISMETHPSLTVLPESLELGEIRGTQPPNTNTTTMQNGGQVLDDISVTHILTLPTSASVQVRKRVYYREIIFLLFEFSMFKQCHDQMIIVQQLIMKMIYLVNYLKILIQKDHQMKHLII